MWEIGVHGWSRVEKLDEAQRALLIDLQDAAARDGNELAGEVTFEVIDALEAMQRCIRARHNAPAPPIDGWRCVIGRIHVRARPPRGPTCPECGETVRN